MKRCARMAFHVARVRRTVTRAGVAYFCMYCLNNRCFATCCTSGVHVLVFGTDAVLLWCGSSWSSRGRFGCCHICSASVVGRTIALDPVYVPVLAPVCPDRPSSSPILRGAGPPCGVQCCAYWQASHSGLSIEQNFTSALASRTGAGATTADTAFRAPSLMVDFSVLVAPSERR